MARKMPEENQETGTEKCYKNGNMNASDIAAMDSSLKVKQYLTAEKWLVRLG